MKTLLSLFVMLLASNCIFPDKSDKDPDAVVFSEFVYAAEDVPFPSCHASTIAETDDGLLVAWFAGTEEKNPDVGIWLSRFSNGEWTAPVEVANGVQSNEKRYPTWNPVLFNTGPNAGQAGVSPGSGDDSGSGVSPGSTLKLFYKVGPSPREWWGEVITSADNGKTWSAPEKLPENIFGPIKNKPVLIEGGRLLSPSSTEDKGWRVHMEISPDTGRTWERTEALNDGRKIALIQPAILKHPEGKIQILCRRMNNAIFSSWSADNGSTWTTPEATVLPNPNSGIDAVTLEDGRHILVYNHIACKRGSKWGDRNILNLAVSDDGVNWKAALLLENDEDEDAEYSYPAVIRTADGNVHIVYTWNRKLIKHVVVDPSKIK